MRQAIAHAINKQDLVDIVYPQDLAKTRLVDRSPSAGRRFPAQSNVTDVPFDHDCGKQNSGRCRLQAGADGVRAKGKVRRNHACNSRLD
ncbi:MAG: hypothetical protein U0559_00290 [Anaerolineae bacterium]